MNAMPMPRDAESGEAALSVAEADQSEDAEGDRYTEEELLAIVQDLAARRNPRYDRFYRNVDPDRIRNAAHIAQRLLECHLRHQRRPIRDRGRRKHAAEIHRLLDETNEGSLELAWAVLCLAFAALPPGPQK